MSAAPTHRKSLNAKQLSVLDLLYRFRFGTTELLTKALNTKHKNKMNERLKILFEQEYIGRHYESEYRLLRKHASYYLSPKGIKALRQSNDNYHEAALRNIYKDKTASDQFIDHNLTIFKIYCDLKARYEDQLKFFTKSQLRQYEYFPDPLPDAYFRISIGDEQKQYFLEALQSTRPFFVSFNKARRYIRYWESGEWDDTGTDLPIVVLACDTPTLQKRLEKQIGKLEDEMDDDELTFHITGSALDELP